MRYRIKQGLRALVAFARPVDMETARCHLAPPLMSLFLQMRRSEQQHSLAVLRTLHAAGHVEPDLMAAALLHDVGKSRAPFHLWDRVLVVLVKAACPRCAARWGKGPPVGWRRPFAVAVQHAEWGAEMLRAAGAPARVVQLVARHDRFRGAPTNETERLVAALRAADEAN